MKILLIIFLLFAFYQAKASWIQENQSIKEMWEKIELLKEEISKTPNDSDNIDEKEKKIELLETKTQILENKVDTIKEKIDENNKKLEIKINDVLENKIKERIKNIKENEKYKNIDKNIKNNLFINYIKLIEIKIISIKKEDLILSQKELKINIFNSLKELIEKEIIN